MNRQNWIYVSYRRTLPGRNWRFYYLLLGCVCVYESLLGLGRLLQCAGDCLRTVHIVWWAPGTEAAAAIATVLRPSLCSRWRHLKGQEPYQAHEMVLQILFSSLSFSLFGRLNNVWMNERTNERTNEPNSFNRLKRSTTIYDDVPNGKEKEWSRSWLLHFGAKFKGSKTPRASPFSFFTYRFLCCCCCCW